MEFVESFAAAEVEEDDDDDEEDKEDKGKEDNCLAGAGGLALPSTILPPSTFFSTINTGVILFLPPFPLVVLCFKRTGLLVPLEVAKRMPLEMEEARMAPTDNPKEASAEVIVG